METTSRYFCLDTVMIDIVMEVEALPRRGGDALSSQYLVTPGGGFNSMSAVTRHGMNAVYVGRLGCGPFSDLARDELTKESIFVPVAANEESDIGFCLVMVDESGERTFVTAPGAEGTLRASDLTGIEVNSGDYVFLSGYNFVYPALGAVIEPWVASLAGDVVEILQGLGLLLRGEVVWWKGRAAGGSCAWGTFQRPSNPVLRDITERIVIASKGRFDRAIRPEKRLEVGLPSTSTISRDEFLEATTDLWEIPPESATRVGHPAPFPVELPRRLIDLFTYEGDVVLDPFMGSGSTAVAAIRGDRHFVGFDTDTAYVAKAKERIKQERDRLGREEAAFPARVRIAAKALPAEGEDPLSRGLRQGLQAKELAGILLTTCGFVDVRPDVKIPGLGLEVHFVAADQTGRDWAFDVSGAFTSNRIWPWCCSPPIDRSGEARATSHSRQ